MPHCSPWLPQPCLFLPETGATGYWRPMDGGHQDQNRQTSKDYVCTWEGETLLPIWLKSCEQALTIKHQRSTFIPEKEPSTDLRQPYSSWLHQLRVRDEANFSWRGTQSTQHWCHSSPSAQAALQLMVAWSLCWRRSKLNWLWHTI